MASRSLGVLTLDLVAKIGGFERGMDQAARISDRRMKQIQATASRVGKVIGTTLLAVGTGAIYGIVRNTIEAEKQMAQLEAVLKSTGHVAGLTSGELTKLADKLQAMSTYEDDAIVGAEALLLTFTRIGRDVFPEALQSILDLSTALGKDLSSSTTLVGKALNDPIAGLTALSKAGVQFADDQKKIISEMVKTNRIGDAQRIVLKELATQFGGSAKAARDTLGGAFEALQHAASNVLEGESGSEGIIGIKKEVNALTDLLNSSEVKEGFQAMIEGLAKVAAYAVNAIAQTNNFRKAINDALSVDTDKSYEGLLTRKRQLEEDLRGLQGGNLGALKQLYFGRDIGDVGEVNIRMSESVEQNRKRLQADLANINQLIKSRSEIDRLNKIAAGIEWIDPPPAGWVAKPKTGTASADADKDAAAKAARELAQAMKEQADAAADFRQQYEDLAATMGGPLAQAELEAIRREDQLADLAARGQISQEELAKALDLVEAQRQKTIAGIEAQLSPAEEVLAALREEYELLGATAEQQETYNSLKRAGVEAESEYGRQITETIAQIQAAREAQAAQEEALQKQIGYMDEFRDSFRENTADVLMQTKSISDAFKSMGDMITQQIARILATKFTDWLFGGQGSSGGGLFGNLFGSLFGGSSGGASLAGGGGSLFSAPGFAGGTDFAPGGMAWVGEEGPELVNLPRGAQVIPAHESARMGMTLNQTINVMPGATRETAEQAARRAGAEARKGLARTG